MKEEVSEKEREGEHNKQMGEKNRTINRERKKEMLGD